jgi:hypothetical protein
MRFLDALSVLGSVPAIADVQVNLTSAGLFGNGPFDSRWWPPLFHVLV